MAPGIVHALPAMQLMCNIVIPEGSGFSIATKGPAVNPSPLLIPSAILPDGYVAHPDIGAAYKVYDTNLSWISARERCIAEGANLAIIDTFTKFERLMNQSESSNPIHVGILRMYDDTEWVNIRNGSTLTDLPWAPNEPNGAYDCVLASKDPLGLRNFQCTSLKNYACELPINEN